MYDLSDDHILLSSSEEMRKICKPLGESISFTYVRFYQNGTHLKLCTCPETQKKMYSEGHVYEGPLFHDKDILLLNTGIYLDSKFCSSRYLSIMQNIYHEKNNGSISIIIRNNAYHEQFYFKHIPIGNVSLVEDFMAIFYGSLPVFKRFCLYFKERAKHLIREAEKHPIDLHRGYEPIPNTHASLNQFCQEKWPVDKRTFLKEIEFRRCQFEDPVIANRIFSRREFECALALIRGETAQSTAEKLFLSRRTVESHIEALKNKLGCLNKTELKKKLLESSVLKFYQDCI